MRKLFFQKILKHYKMIYSVIRRVRIKKVERLLPLNLSERVDLVFQTDSKEAAKYYYENIVTETPEWYLITSHLVFSNSNGQITKTKD